LRSKAVLVREEDWNCIRETLYLLSIPGIPADFLFTKQAKKTPAESHPRIAR